MKMNHQMSNEDCKRLLLQVVNDFLVHLGHTENLLEVEARLQSVSDTLSFELCLVANDRVTERDVEARSVLSMSEE